MTSYALRLRSALRTDLTASLVVFLVALPLCVGVAVASGAPAELGLITGIVGGLITGLLPGSSLQVSGPAAGLTVLVYDAVHKFGLSALGVIVLLTGAIQLGLGAARLGGWFRAIPLSVVQGMLAGIGLVLIAGQLYTLNDGSPPGSGADKVKGLPGLAADTAGSGTAFAALVLGASTIAIMALWRRLPAPARLLPGPLAAVGAATAATAVFDLRVDRVQVSGLLSAVQPPHAADFGRLAEPALLATVVAFTLIASAESLFSAAAVDRLHSGPRTDYDKELMAQGAGNAVCGLLGALPMTAVIVRSAANVQAGARTKASRVLHGLWLLLFVALFPAALGRIPTAALAGVLVHAGWKLLPLGDLRVLWRERRGEAAVLVVTAVSILVTDMFEGVVIGLLLAVVKTAWETSHVHVETVDPGPEEPLRVRVLGNATFLRLPRILDALASLPPERSVHLDLAALRHLDHACMHAMQSWADEHNAAHPQAVRRIHTA